MRVDVRPAPVTGWTRHVRKCARCDVYVEFDAKVPRDTPPITVRHGQIRHHFGTVRAVTEDCETFWMYPPEQVNGERTQLVITMAGVEHDTDPAVPAPPG